MKSSTAAIFTLATIAGLGTTVWTVATTEPARVEVVDDFAASIGGVKQRPDIIDAWIRAARILLRTEASISRVADRWLDALGEEWTEQLGAEAMIWYALSLELARREDHFSPDYTLPRAIAARKKAIDLLLKHSQTSPEHMRYWHWNSLAWAWVRSGQYRSARGALERTEAAIHALPPETPSSEVGFALVRLASCWGPDGLGDREAQVDALLRAEPLLLKHEERWNSGRYVLNGVWLATHIGATGDSEAEAAVMRRALARYTEEMKTEDRRAAWFAVVNTHDNGLMSVPNLEDANLDPWMHALSMLSIEVEEHGQRGDMNWNRIGWSYWNARAEDKARAAWREWLGSQEAAVAEAATPGNLYNLACARSLTGDVDGAFDALARAVELGWWDRTHTQRDRDLGFIAGDERFAALLAAMRFEDDERRERSERSVGPSMLRQPNRP